MNILHQGQITTLRTILDGITRETATVQKSHQG